MVCENPEKSVVAQKLGGCGHPPPPPATPGITPLIANNNKRLWLLYSYLALALALALALCRIQYT